MRGRTLLFLQYVKWPVRSLSQKYASWLSWWQFRVKHRRLNRTIAKQYIGHIAEQKKAVVREYDRLKKLEADRADSVEKGAGLFFAKHKRTGRK